MFNDDTFYTLDVLSALHLSLSISWLLSMGNVLAAGSPSPPPPVQAGPGSVSVPAGFTMPAVSPVSPASSGKEESEPALPNPGAFEEFHRKCKGVKHILLRSSSFLCHDALRLRQKIKKHNERASRGIILQTAQIEAS